MIMIYQARSGDSWCYPELSDRTEIERIVYEDICVSGVDFSWVFYSRPGQCRDGEWWASDILSRNSGHSR